MCSALTRRSKADSQNNYSALPPGSTSRPCSPAAAPPPTGEEPETHWVEIELLGEDDKPIPGETYRIQLSDGTLVKEGSLDMQGKARVDKIEPETCLVSFPNLGDGSWDII